MGRIYFVGAMRRRAFRRLLQRHGMGYREERGLLDSQFVLDIEPRWDGMLAAEMRGMMA